MYQHFRKDEHPFVNLVLDWLKQVEEQYAPYVTDFLDPRQMFIVESLVGKSSDVKLAFFGGFDSAERHCAILYPDYYEVQNDDYDIVLVDIKYPVKFANISHGKILGTILSTGIERECIGDIITDGEQWQVFLKKSITPFVCQQVDKISNVGVRLLPKELTDVIHPTDDWQEETLTISSLRIDNLVSSVYNISRQRSKKLIESGNVKLNWRVIDRPDVVLDYNDMLSVRGFGRVQLKELEGKTKKDKFRLAIRCLRK